MKSVSRHAKSSKPRAARKQTMPVRTVAPGGQRSEPSASLPLVAGSEAELSLPTGPFAGPHSRHLRASHHLQHEHELDRDLPEVPAPQADYVLEDR